MEQLPVMFIMEENRMDSAILKSIFKKEYTVQDFLFAEDIVKRLEDGEEADIILINTILLYQKKVQILSELMKKERYRNTVLIAIVEAGNQEMIQTAMDIGADEIITKPYPFEFMKKRVENLLFSKMYREDRKKRKLKTAEVRRRGKEIDPLTGIYNASAFYRRTRAMLNANPDTEYALMFWNIDCFKVINDLFGRSIGDEVLCELAKQFKKDLTDKGTYGRITADNFVCCFPARYMNPEAVEERTSYDFRALGVEYKVVLHLGIYMVDERDIPVSLMCDRAKMAISTIKGQYNQKFAVYDKSLREELLERQMITSDMETALREHQFFVQIQPIYQADSRVIVSGEALVRWRHPVRGVIPPYKFIPIFEQNGMITKLDYYVWEETCKIICKMKEQGENIVPISVNVSRINLANQNLCRDIQELLDRYGLTTDNMKLEITESAYTESPEQLMMTVQRLKEGNFDILMDDFGSGYSSLNMLKDLPVDILKVDMRFMDEIETSGRTVNVVTSIVRMAKWLNMIVVAEGVETIAQASFLESIGCDRIQGYLYSKPLDKEIFLEKIEKNDSVECHSLTDEAYGKLDFEQILSNVPMNAQMFFNEMMGALGLFRISDGEITILRVNDKYYEIFGETPNEIFHDGQNFTQMLSEEEYKKLYSCCKRARLSRRVEQVELLYETEDEQLRLNMKVKYAGHVAEGSTFYFGISDSTKQKKQNLDLCYK